ncbi:BrnT family toxin [Azorhizobium doebereinerae]|uniref:BrnT family toxin n=1 Tax=Azorhizobium doebereinerae TaxID=281091 RepID=UPI000422BE6C|nr:BrnT family toxin [Azorhizobium doebereinerae]
MNVTCDPGKRLTTLAERGIDFMDAAEVFAGKTLTLEDDRFDYGEIRFQTYGFLAGRMVMVVRTPRSDARHVISMRHCHDKEARQVRPHMG